LEFGLVIAASIFLAKRSNSEKDVAAPPIEELV
jgi:hypothetical protein